MVPPEVCRYPGFPKGISLGILRAPADKTKTKLSPALDWHYLAGLEPAGKTTQLHDMAQLSPLLE
jgi:hypothetical protein